MSKQRPIIFNTEMVQALDAGIKTQTRRVTGLDTFNWQPGIWKFERFAIDRGFTHAFFSTTESDGLYGAKCPYGKVGDLLWVRETWAKAGWGDTREYVEPAYKALNNKHMCGGWKPSIHMPKDAARIWLKVVDVRVERLKSIAWSDALKEGVEEFMPDVSHPGTKRYIVGYLSKSGNLKNNLAKGSPITEFFSLWKDINGEDSVRKNPWVWVVEFDKVENPALSTNLLCP